MSTLQLYLACVAIWGSTWIAITYQLGEVAPAASVFYRFLLSALLLFLVCRWRGLVLSFSGRQHMLLALQGIMMFSISYILIYHAELYVVSGLVAVGYSASPLLNMACVRLLYGTPMSGRVALGSVLGVLGIALVFAPELAHVQGNQQVMLGVAYTAAAVVISAVASALVSRNAHHQLPVWQSMAWGMLYGAGGSLLITLVTHEPLTFSLAPGYLSSLLYLAIFGSILAFAAYYTLIARIGAARAGYIGVMVPVVALVISAFFENFQWRIVTVAGIVLSLAGNLIVLRSTGDSTHA